MRVEFGKEVGVKGKVTKAVSLEDKGSRREGSENE